MKTFGFKGNNKKNIILKYLGRFNITFFNFLLIFYLIFALTNSVSTIVLAQDKLEAAKSNLQDLSILFWSADKKLSRLFLSVDSLIRDYEDGNNLLQENEGDILSIANYLKNNQYLIEKFGLEDYKDVIEFGLGLLKYKDDIFDLLGKNNKQKYIVVLQNTNEVRPNGGFFGSFALLEIDSGRIDFKIIDSYYIDYVNSGVYLKIPDWANKFMDEEKIGFVAGNKFGFSGLDGANLKALYEKVFVGDKIRGVVFVRSDLFESIMPGFKEKLWEWQFLNASIDLIRGDNLPNKKELYIQEVNKYFKNNQMKIFKGLMKNFAVLKNRSNLTIYLNGIEKGLREYLTDNNLTNEYNEDYIYCWDYNRGYNKIDGFVEKSVVIEDLSGNTVANPEGNIIDTSEIGTGDYKIYIYYDLIIPSKYDDFIFKMEQKYNINLNYREHYILGQDSIWDNEGLVYLPKNFNIIEVKGDIRFQKEFNTPFSNNFSYRLKSKKKIDLKYVELLVRKN